jgi:hypothetical protein
MIMLVGAGIGIAGTHYFKKKNKNNKSKDVRGFEKYRKYYDVTNRWILLKNEGISIEKYFIDRGINSIAIYGMGELGNRLLEELKTSNSVEVKYGIDRAQGHTYIDFPIKSLKNTDERYDDVDLIVVTAVFDMEKIRIELESKTKSEIVSLDDVVFGL